MVGGLPSPKKRDNLDHGTYGKPGGCPQNFNSKSKLGQRYDPTSPYITFAIFPWQTELVLGLQVVGCFGGDFRYLSLPLFHFLWKIGPQNFVPISTNKANKNQ